MHRRQIPPPKLMFPLKDWSDDEDSDEPPAKKLFGARYAALAYKQVRILAGGPGGQMIRHFAVAASRWSDIAHFHYLFVENIRGHQWSCPQTMGWISQATLRFFITHPQQGLPCHLWNLHRMENELNTGLSDGFGYPKNANDPVLTQVKCFAYECHLCDLICIYLTLI